MEFLEFLGRVSPLKFQGSELEDQIDLTTKIEYVMDDLLALVDSQRNEVEQESDESESGGEESDDYWKVAENVISQKPLFLSLKTKNFN